MVLAVWYLMHYLRREGGRVAPWQGTTALRASQIAGFERVARPQVCWLRETRLSATSTHVGDAPHMLEAGVWEASRVRWFCQRLFLRHGLATKVARGFATISTQVLMLLTTERPAVTALCRSAGIAAAGIPTTGGELVSPDLALGGRPFAILGGLAVIAWRTTSYRGWGSFGGPFEHSEGTTTFFFNRLAASLRLTYRIRYHALDRKIRKIVKNKYRYVRSYVCIREAQRVRYGLRLLPLGMLLCPERRWELRLGALLQTLLWSPQVSVLRQLRLQHHQTALGALGLV